MNDPGDAVDPDDLAELSTGEAQVDAAVARLAELDERDVDEHADVFDDIHRTLGKVLDGSGSAEPSE